MYKRSLMKNSLSFPSLRMGTMRWRSQEITWIGLPFCHGESTSHCKLLHFDNVRKENLNTSNVRTVLEKDHFGLQHARLADCVGLEEVKERILEFIAVSSRKKSTQGKVWYHVCILPSDIVPCRPTRCRQDVDWDVHCESS
jgi:hypothetical protein